MEEPVDSWGWVGWGVSTEVCVGVWLGIWVGAEVWGGSVGAGV